MRKRRAVLERPTPRKIAALAKRIAGRFRPDRIILFGSHAYGRPTPDSDVDLLVVMKTSRRPAEQAAGIRRVVSFPFPVDLLVRTPRQIQQRLAMGDCFIREILTEGKVLYEAPDE